MDAQQIAHNSGDFDRTEKDWRIKCPVHNSADNDLAVWDKPGGYIGVKCWGASNCSTDDILRALGIPLGSGTSTNPWRTPSPTAEYSHPDGVPRHSYRVNYPEHFEYKDQPCSYRKKGKDGKLGKECGRTDIHKHPYNSRGLRPRGTYLLRWIPDKPDNTIVIVEGEKAALALKQHVQFVNPFTPVSWYGGVDTRKLTALTFSETEDLTGRACILWPDNHMTGVNAMKDLARRIQREAKASSIHIVNPERLSEKDDAADVDYDTAIDLLRTAVEWTEILPADAMAPLLRTATVMDLNGTDNDSLDKLRDDVIRKAAQTISHKFINLFGEWYQRASNAWQIAEEEYIKMELSLATIEVCEFALSRQQKSDALDRLKDIISPSVNNIEVLPRWKRQSSFNMDTGDLVDGVVFGEVVLSVDDSGSINYRDTNDREFLRYSINYDLPSEPKETPLFDKYLDTSLSSPDDAELLKENIGRALCGRRSEQIISFLQGPGGSGKGTIFSLLRLLLDRNYSSANSFEKIAGRFGASKMIDSLAYAFTDVKPMPGRGTSRDIFMEGASTIKSISGQDAVDIEIKNIARGYSVQLQCSIWVASNFAPKWIDGVEDSEAWRRRMCPIIFEQSIPDEEKIPDLAEKIFAEEGPDVAMRCIQAFAGGIARGNWPQLTERSEKNLRSWIDSAKGDQAMFVENYLIHSKMEEEYLSYIHLRVEYSKHMGLDEALDGRSSQIRQLFDAVRDTFGIDSVRISGAGRSGGVGEGFRGIRWRTEADNVDENTSVQSNGDESGHTSVLPDKAALPESTGSSSICGVCGEDNPGIVVDGLCEACAL